MSSVSKIAGLGLGLVFALIGLTIFMNIASSTIPAASESYYALATGYNATIVGDAANSIATSSTDWMGYLWVLLPFAVGVALVVGVMKKGQ